MADVRGRLVELDPDNAAFAREWAASAGLDGLEVVNGDASVRDAYAGLAPVDLVVISGVFGHVDDDDKRQLVAFLPQLCAPGASLVWTSHRTNNGPADKVRAMLAEESFEEVAFEDLPATSTPSRRAKHRCGGDRALRRPQADLHVRVGAGSRSCRRDGCARSSLRLERKSGRGRPRGGQASTSRDGAWAGPVTVAAVVPAPEHLRGVRDSKMLRRPERERAAASVRRWAVAVGVGHASYHECDELGMTAALRTAALRALAELDAQGYVPDRIILDGNHDYLAMPDKVTTVVKGDATCLSVAAASCVAKVVRDGLMAEADAHYPPYDFASNVGYPAPAHKVALLGYGPSAIHRRSWVFMDGLCWRGVAPAPGRLFV
jgi:ribonuclease HII